MHDRSFASKAAVSIAVILVAACASKPAPAPVMIPVTASPAPAAPPPAPPVRQTAPAPAPLAPQAAVIPGTLKDFQVNVGDTVYFSFDSSSLEDPARNQLQKQAAWLSRYRNIKLQVQGNCDERGTREYNLALGARRAASVRDYLVSLGVAPSRVSTISYGKERPVCAESSEACWAQNRRAVSAISGEATPVAMR